MPANKEHLYMPPKRVKMFQKMKQAARHIDTTDIVRAPRGVIKAFEKKINSLGVFDEHMQPVESAQIKWEHLVLFQQKLGDTARHWNDIPYIDADAIYLGQTIGHFGHFLINTLDRAWPAILPEFKGAKIVLVNHNYNHAEYFKLLEYMGVDPKNIIILDTDTRFRNVLVPQRGFKYYQVISDQYINVFKQIASNVTTEYPYDKIYVSRCRFINEHNAGNLQFGEQKIEEIFRKNGYHVIYPEQLSITDQIAYMKNCRSLAGVAGTALHLALFMQDGTQVIQIQRSRIGFPFAQAQINDAKNIDAHYIDASIEKYATTHSATVPQIIGVNEYFKKFLDDNKFVYDATDIAFDTDEYAKYTNACRQIPRMKFIRSQKLRKFIKFWLRLVCMFIPIKSVRHNIRNLA